MLLANLSAKDGRPVDINDLAERGGIASARGPFDYLLLIDSSLLTADEIDRLRPAVYEQLAQGAADDETDSRTDVSDVRFVKAHDAYTLTADGTPLLAGACGADGAIVVVRDPRDVAVSLSNHLGTDVDGAISFMNRPNAAFGDQPERMVNQLRQQLLDWSEHVASWLDQADIPIHLIRYEDLKADTIGTFRLALDFAGRAATDEQIERAVRFADFDELRAQEQTNGFREAPPRPGQAFFRRGVAGAWRDELTPDQVARIESAHAPTMRRLAYALSTEPDVAQPVHTPAA